MYRLTVLAEGKLKEAFWREAAAEYEKRLRPFAKTRAIEVGNVQRKHFPKDALVVALIKEGRQHSSEEFAAFLKREGETGRELVFVVGGPHGSPPELVEGLPMKISLSKLTFTHGEARAVLFEQLYRAMTILHGKTYHY
jgi:23S rRNA (pseudouridine1915-N3)-methyltransferase